ncbi:YhjD/YihY/BrkB family envelope integrity protein [Natronolimnohabitans innermongolicus]|uniref:Ribonuclease BN n=1 Tax=Natronolimnohabitans innermongolicus JCM 12255 TaxID=1227499 RepID=L9XJM6_9EURY|nr:YhjD/YihY/BrkB family envelope integrity protein [Natronolimnohabitans innermongolicus]ELY61925.1 ribonuclease BN [Natronolimnohabitans innermongolicus JCM 12255]
MSSVARDGIAFGKAVVDGISEKNVPFMAASIAYQAFISLLPLLVLVFFFVTIVGDEQFAQQVTETTEGALPESGQLLVEESLEDSPATAGSTIIGIVVLIWGSLKIFRGLDTAFSEIYGTTNVASFVDQIRDALIVFGAIGGALLAAAGMGVLFAFLPNIPGFGLLQSLLLVVLLTLAFYPMYYYFPDVDATKREVIPGVLLAAVGWMALQSLFRVYVSFAAEEGGGAVGAIILLLTWLYFGGLILLSGAVVNAIGTGYLEPGDDESEDADGEETRPRPREPMADSITATGREPFVDGAAREHRRLRQRAETLERERDQYRNDLLAQRSRRYRLEDRVDDLEASIRDLEAENERLRRDLAEHERREERRRADEPEWKRAGRALLGSVQEVNVGTIERREK